MSNPIRKEAKILIDTVTLQKRVSEMAEIINSDYQQTEITAICILKGSFIFFSDILRGLRMPLSTEFLAVSSYGNEKVSSGEVKVTLDINEPLEGKHVIIFEDIVDSGITLSFLIANLKARRPASLKVCSLLVKPDQMKVNLPIDYTGFKIGNEFVVGYGMDYAQKYRELPYIGVLE